MDQTYDYSYERDPRYCYPGSDVLKNKLDITDKDNLQAAEREITSLRIAAAKLDPIAGDFDLAHLSHIHRYIFGDIYDWAGEPRQVNIAKGNLFCLPEHIEEMAGKLFAKLKQENLLRDVAPEAMPERLSYYLCEINALHPFREGNGRVQRLFIEYLAENAGYGVDFAEVSDQEMIEASDYAFRVGNDKMDALFRRITAPLDGAD